MNFINIIFISILDEKEHNKIPNNQLISHNNSLEKNVLTLGRVH